MLAWYHDIEQLVQLPHMSLSQRQTFIASHTPDELLDRQRQSGSSSPGLDEDEADEVPFSQVNSVDDTASPSSPQRPQPGGSFPSETRLDDAAMYDTHSRTASDVTSEIHPARLSNEGDVAAVFGEKGDRESELERPYTGHSAGSIGDDRDFSTAAMGAGVGAAAAGAAMLAARKNTDETEGTKTQDQEYGEGKRVAAPHEAAAYYAGTAALTTSSSTAQDLTNHDNTPLSSPTQPANPMPAHAIDGIPSQTGDGIQTRQVDNAPNNQINNIQDTLQQHTPPQNPAFTDNPVTHDAG